jgi:LCP family protein required for cell wall assembly
VLSAAVLVGSGLAWRAVGGLDADLATTALGLGGGDSGDTHDDGATDVLLVGTDSRTDAKGNPLTPQELDLLRAGDVATTNTDTIILIRVPDGGGSATALSIPRDSYVDVAGGGKAKINGVYGAAKQEAADAMVADGADPAATEGPSTEAGRQALVSTVQQLTGVTVDHYAEIGLLGFVLLTNAVDGVPVCLRNAVDEPLSGARLPAGEQTLTGSDALSFVRQRHDLPHGDLDRIRRQQAFMASLAGKVLSAGTLAPGRIGALSDALARSVVIDDGWDVLGFAQQLQGLAGGRVTFRTVPVLDTDATSDDGESVVTVDPAAVRAAAAEVVGRTPATTTTSPPAPTPSRPSTPVEVANASGAEGLASDVATALGTLGFTPGPVGNNPAGTRAESAVMAADPDDAGAAAVASALGGLPVQTDDALSAGEVRVVVGTDYTGPGSAASAGTDPATATTAPGVVATTPAAPPPAPDPIAAAPDPRCVD